MNRNSMSLRMRTIVLLGAMMVVLIIVLYVVVRTTVLAGYADLETESATRDTQRVSQAISSRMEALGTVVTDWAPWDDTFEFVSGEYGGYVADNLNVDTVSNLDVNFMAFYDTSGKLLHATTVDLDEGVEIASPDFLTTLLSVHPELGESEIGEATSDWISTPVGPLLAAGEPIVHSDFSGPPAGTLVVGRYLDDALAGELANLTDLDLEFVPADASDFATPAELLTADEPVAVVVESSRVIAGYVRLADHDGELLGAMRASIQRVVYQQGLLTTRYLLLALLAVGTAAGLAIGFFMNTNVLNRVRLLASQVKAIAESKDAAWHVSVQGGDELAGLAEDIEGMLTSLRMAQYELRDARDTMEARVQERTAQLQESVEALQIEIGERRRAEDALRTSEERYRTLVNSMVDAVFTIDLSGRFTYANPRSTSLFGHPADKLLTMTLFELLERESAHKLEKRFARLGTGRAEDIELVARMASGKTVPIELGIVPLLDSSGVLVARQGIARDTTDRKRYEAELLHMASHDHLTGLYNRRMFEQELDRELAEVRRRGGSGSILWFDLDHFKEVNDSLGHRSGDDLLVNIADVLRTNAREDSVLARLGGDEFAVLLPHSELPEAQRAADRMLELIRTSTTLLDGHPVRVTASIGIGMYPEHGTSVEELLARADLAMYVAKETGRDRSAVYVTTDEWRTEIADRRTWAERIEEALQNDGFVVWAQPIHDLQSSRVIAYELLIRMRDEDGTVITPDRFLGAAERVGLIKQIDRWMLGQAAELLARQNGDSSLSINVNVSARAFIDTGLLEHVEAVLEKTGANPNRLGIEITESAIIADLARAQHFAARLKELGCSFLLDDFGSGFSSFFHLKHLPIDHLKIDGSFIRRLTENDADQHLVRAMVEMARGLGMRTTAEFVETAETVEMLRAFGVDCGQGYYLGRPGPADEILPEEERSVSA